LVDRKTFRNRFISRDAHGRYLTTTEIPIPLSRRLQG
jgi:hypothetical protein